ncbi:MAG: hypothetical protein BWY98_00930 [Tenericutes bacterium ADurb.BinA155]|jgi:hypothetical protein|nr:MAG: hypothetical protein BWY98_00930 [Tenericutes bacterium ADurb.BinA155]
METLADTVRNFRKGCAHMSKESFCLYAGITMAELRNIGRGYKPSDRIYYRLSSFMGLPVEALKELATAYPKKLTRQSRKLH